MSESREIDQEPLVAVAKAVRTRGLKGELVADLLTDFPERFDTISELVALGTDGQRKTVTIENHWFHKNRLILKLKGYDSVEEANELVGHEFAVPESERVPLEEGSFYEWELQGCAVETKDGKRVGEVTGVMRTGGVGMLVVRNDEKHELLVPMAESIIVQIDVNAKRILIDPPEGLLEL